MNTDNCKISRKTRDDFLKEVARPMAKRRKELKMTQEDVNHKLGVADFLVAKWECGMRTPTSFNLVCWAEVLGGEIVFVVNRASTSEITTKQAKNDNKLNNEKSK